VNTDEEESSNKAEMKIMQNFFLRIPIEPYGKIVFTVRFDLLNM
jgi:hypothetical protein